MVSTLTVNEKEMRAAASRGFSTATDLADWLVRALNLPFRQAHHVTGTLVGIAEKKGVDLDALSLAEMQAVEPGITDAVYSVLGVDNSVKSRTSFGGTSPDNVRAAAAFWRNALGRNA
jgi:argininosuccinate lyase